MGRTFDDDGRGDVGPVLLASARATIEGIVRSSGLPGTGSSSLTSLTGAPLVSAASEMMSSMEVVGFAGGVVSATSASTGGAASTGLLSAIGSWAGAGVGFSVAVGRCAASWTDMGSAGAAVARGPSTLSRPSVMTASLASCSTWRIQSSSCSRCWVMSRAGKGGVIARNWPTSAERAFS
jgi:hypothetical protein